MIYGKLNLEDIFNQKALYFKISTLIILPEKFFQIKQKYELIINCKKQKIHRSTKNLKIT